MEPRSLRCDEPTLGNPEREQAQQCASEHIGGPVPDLHVDAGMSTKRARKERLLQGQRDASLVFFLSAGHLLDCLAVSDVERHTREPDRFAGVVVEEAAVQ